jgi:hypothetical protein
MLLALMLCGCWASLSEGWLGGGIPSYIRSVCPGVSDSVLQLAVDEVQTFRAQGYSRAEILDAETQSCVYGFGLVAGAGSQDLAQEMCSECMSAVVDYAYGG